MASQPQAVAKAAAPAQSATPMAVPAIVARARVGFELLHAHVNYKDETSGIATTLNDLNFVAKDLSLSRPSQVSIWSDFDTRVGKDESAITVKGPGPH